VVACLNVFYGFYERTGRQSSSLTAKFSPDYTSHLRRLALDLMRFSIGMRFLMALRVVVSRGLLFLKILGIRFDAVGLMAFLYCLFKLCFHIFCQFSLIYFIS
jgi:hypothetical protein